MPKHARDPVAVAALLITLLLVALMLFLLTAVVRKRTAARPAPFIPPGWVEPTSPPPSRNNPPL